MGNPHDIDEKKASGSARGSVEWEKVIVPDELYRAERGYLMGMHSAISKEIEWMNGGHSPVEDEPE